MIPGPITLSELTSGWVSALLEQAGVPGADRLVAIRQRSNPSFNHQVVHLELEYAHSPFSSSSAVFSAVHGPSPAAGSPPSSLLLKVHQHGEGETEVLFYQQAAGMDLPMLVDCYAAQFDKNTGNSYLLLQDVSKTHQAPVSRQALLSGKGVPGQGTLIGIAAALAHFHAAWWERQLTGSAAPLTNVRGWYTNAQSHARHCLRRRTELESFLSTAGSDISPGIPPLLERALDRLPGLWNRYLKSRLENYRQVTLTHGDCYLTQFLVPGQPGEVPVYLIDFDSASGNLPAYDLVYLLPTFWTRTQRLENARERHFLLHYHTILCQAGVENYSFADLCHDYRLMLCYMIFDAPADQFRGSSPAYWHPKLRCLVEAYQDWECDVL